MKGPWTYTRDSFTGLDYADQRFFASIHGRFNTADPYRASGGAAKPGSWNRDVYVMGDPVNLIDPRGLVACNPEAPACQPDHGGVNPQDPGGTPGDGCGPPVMDFGFSGMAASGCGDPGPDPGGDPGADPPKMKNCEGEARVLQGNASLIGKSGGFSGDSVGNFPVTAGGAAIILSQWHSTKADFRPYIGQISGSGPGWSFTGVDDIVGGTPPPGYSDVQKGLLALFPGKLIIELPGAPKDLGVTTVKLTIPSQLDCPDGTKEVH